jgi:CDP-diacylglycerol--glycerol-3-phosphate 3-phosphatidyltransferase
MNLPNKLTVTRICIIPLFMIFLLIPIPFPTNGDMICRIIAAVLFLAASITDHLDGKIARKYNLVTDFGKFLDPLADKMMVLGAMIGLTVLAGKGADCTLENSVYFRLTATLTFVVLFRELAVTSLRLAASGAKGVVIAANILGKTKTVVQIVFVMTALLEPVIMGEHLLGRFSFFAAFAQHHILSYVLMALTAVMTVWSGLSYFKGYFPLINSNK